MREAQASTLALSTFRKRLRVELPFPVTPQQSPQEIRWVVHHLAEAFAAGLADAHGEDRVHVSYPDSFRRACILRAHHEEKQRQELQRVRQMRPAMVVVVCPQASEAAFFHRLAQAVGNHTPFVVFNVLWEKRDFGASRDAPKELWESFAAEFDGGIAYCLDEVTVPCSALDSMLGKGVQMAVLKKYGHGWSTFLKQVPREGEGEEHEEYKFLMTQKEKPTMVELRELASSSLSGEDVSPLARLRQMVLGGPAAAPSCPLGYKYDDGTGRCMPM